MAEVRGLKVRKEGITVLSEGPGKTIEYAGSSLSNVHSPIALQRCARPWLERTSKAYMDKLRDWIFLAPRDFEKCPWASGHGVWL